MNESMQLSILEQITQKDVHFTIGDWNEKLESRKISAVTGKFGLGGQNEAGQSLTVLSEEHTAHSKHLPTTRDNPSYINHQMVNTKMRLIIFLQLKIEKLYTVSKNKIRS